MSADAPVGSMGTMAGKSPQASPSPSAWAAAMRAATLFCGTPGSIASIAAVMAAVVTREATCM